MKRAEGGFDFCAGVDVVGDIVDEGGDGDAACVCLGGAGDGFTAVLCVFMFSLPIVIAERRGALGRKFGRTFGVACLPYLEGYWPLA